MAGNLANNVIPFSDYMNIFSANARGLRQPLKRLDLWKKFQELKSSVIFLQETHLVGKDVDQLKKEWNVEFFISGTSTNSRGVAIIIIPNFEYKVIECIRDEEGRYIFLTIEVDGRLTLTLINIYGPNNDDPDWYNTLFNKVSQYESNALIIAGDWNTALKEEDFYNYKLQRNIKSCQLITKNICNKNLIDIWRLQNLSEKRFTWGTKKPYKRARLDYFIINEDLLSFNPETDILPAYKSDHNIIKLSFKISPNVRGRGSWKLNNDLLKHKDLITLIKNEIKLAKETYALPIYNPETIHLIDEMNLELMVSDTLFLNTILCQIRGIIISFSKKVARDAREEEKNLSINIDKSTKLLDDTNMSTDERELEIVKLNSLNKEYQSIRENRLKGHQVRSRAELSAHWEKPSRFFLNLEKKNYLNKNISELLDENDVKITDSDKILKMQQSFYQDLFAGKNTIALNNSTFSPLLDNLPCLSENCSRNLERPYSLAELEDSIKRSKLNKAPGPDGYTNEFFKFFKEELKIWLFRTYQEAYRMGSLSDLITMGTITCIPKAGKLRNSLKNWRPLTLLNGSYKFLSSMIAERLKTVLESIINNDQTGFISNRFIGENTRLLYDTISYVEEEQIPGLLIIVDYAKAFDTIEWKFIDEVFKIFGFGPNFSNWIKLLRKNSRSKIEQNGFFSDHISLSRGCRQGDPISPYVFVLCAEILSHVIREKKDIKGIVVYDKETKLSQYADDTTIYLGGDKESLCGVMRVLEWFRKVSGLAINKDKTNVIKIGALRGRSITWEGKFGLKWTTEFEVLGIKYNIDKMESITDDNISSKLSEIKKLISIWSTRSLTPYGKVVIIRSLLMSKITHILLSLPTPSKTAISQLEQLFFSFLWCNKPPKFRREIMEANTVDGGLKLHNLTLFDAALKIGWLRRYIVTRSKWNTLPYNCDFDGLFRYGVDYIERLLEITFNPFWLNVLNSLKMLWKDDKIYICDNIFLTPLWYNNILRMQIKKDWLLRGVYNINDLLHADGKFLTQIEFETKFNLQTNFLEYGAVLMKIKAFLQMRETPLYSHSAPNNCLLNVILQKDTKGVSTIYKLLLGKNTSIVENACFKWNEKLGNVTESFDFKKSFTKLNMFDDIYLRYIQFRTLHRRFFTNNILFKMRIKNSPLCTFCNESDDSNEHMLIECGKVKTLWMEVENWIAEVGVVGYVITDRLIILGELQKAHWINAVILLTKKVIFNSRINDTCPTFSSIKTQVKNLYKYEKYKYTLCDREDKLEKRWGMMLDYLEE